MDHCNSHYRQLLSLSLFDVFVFISFQVQTSVNKIKLLMANSSEAT